MLRNWLILSILLLCSLSLNVKADEVSRPQGLVFLMHGCRQTDDDFNKSTDLEARLKEAGYEVAYIKKQFLNFYDCWQWFYREGFTRDSSMMKSYFQEIQEAQKKFKVTPEQTYLVGFSSGAGMALNIAMCSENLVGAVALHAGTAFARVSGGSDGLHFMKNPKNPRYNKILSSCDPTQYKGHVLTIHGHDDDVVHRDHSEIIMQDLGAVKSHQRTHIKNSCEEWLNNTHLVTWEKGKQKFLQILVSKLGHEWGGGNPKYKYTKKEAPSTTDAIVNFFKNL